MRSSMRTIEPIAHWDVRPWGCPMVKIADFNGDGESEVLFLQSAGAHANEAFDPRSDIEAGYKTGVEDQDLFCMTLVDRTGEIIWQVGEPWKLDRPFSWNGHWSEFCDVVDLDADGRVEFMFVHQNQLRVYDGATGELRHTRKMPNSGFGAFVRAVRIDHSGNHHIFAKSGTSSRTHSYGNPSILMDHELNIVWEKDDVPGAGHFGNYADIDGDGLHELVIGFSLYDSDRKCLWSHEPLSPGDHLDGSAVADADGDGDFVIAMAHDGHDATVHNIDGTVRFRAPMHHCQDVTAMKLFDDVPGQQLVFIDKATGPLEDRNAVITDGHGEILSQHPSPGYYSVVNWPSDHGPNSLIRVERPFPLHGEHRVLWVDPTGKELARLDVRSSFADHIERAGLDPRSDHAMYHGATLTPSIGDLNGDGRDELLVTDRESVWVFSAP